MVVSMDQDAVELKADQILDQYRDLIEWRWDESGREGMGPRFIRAVEVPRPDGLVTFAIRPTRWNSVVEMFCPSDEDVVVVVVRLIEGTVIRAIPRPAND
jgi:hypothetical protein